MIFFDVEVFKYNWMMCYLDTDTRTYGSIIDSKSELEIFYNNNKNKIWCGYNSRNYDVWIIKSILCDFNPFDMSSWIIVNDRKGYEYSKLLNRFPILNFDCSYYFRSLKELEGFLGKSIKETPIPFNIDRKLTNAEIDETLKYCMYDVECTFEVFVETKSEFESHIGLIKEFGLSIDNINKTKAQISASILGAVKKEYNDEFDITFPDSMVLGKYSYISDWYRDWSKNIQDYSGMSFSTEISGVPHTFGIGGLHGSRDNYFGDGFYLMADVASYYPALMIEYNYLSRSVLNPNKYTQIRNDRLVMKQNKDPREYPRKIVLNSTFGAQKDKYNNLYDPLQANNICIAGQLLLVDLLEKIERTGKAELIQSNTDGILIKLFTKSDKSVIIDVCDEWSKRTRMNLEFDEITRVIQRDVNNYIMVFENGKIKRKGAVVKKLNRLDNDLPIVNKAVVDYFVDNIPVEKTILECNELIMFQKISKIGQSYEYVQHNGKILNERVNRCFASIDPMDGTLFKKDRAKTTLDKTPSTPTSCFIDNSDILEKTIPVKLDKQWYIDLALDRIKNFI